MRQCARARRGFALFAVAALLQVALPARSAAPALAAGGATSVTIAGTLQQAIGCPSNWQPDCAASHLAYDANSDVWSIHWSLPAGGYQYKAAIDDSWAENYGLHAVPNGANIPLNLAAGSDVRFYYDAKTHWATDNQGSVIAGVPGDFQTQLGCSANWDPACLRTWLEDPAGSGTYSFVTTNLTHGSYQAKVAINQSWALNYGAGGAPNGPNIPFTVPVDHAKVTFRYDPGSHLLSIASGHAHDNNVEYVGLRHDSRDPLYRTPGGAAPAGTPVTIRLRTFHDDVTAVDLRLYDLNSAAERYLPMQIAASDVSCYQPELVNDTCDFWSVALQQPAPDNLWYRFVVRDGSAVAYYADDTPALDGGPGSATPAPVDNSYALMFYDPAFRTPAWAQGAVIYQIFPDRFRDGDPKNDPKTGDPRYDDPVLALPWGTLPEGYCNSYAVPDSQCPWRFDPTRTGREAARGRDYMGGDLQGIREKLGYLQQLGVTALYLNPIFWAKSNHRYDTADYQQIDPALGTLDDFEKLVVEARAHHMHLILDGVFNHMSSDSPAFDRYRRYPVTGACESAASPFRSWFSFRPPNPGEPGPCAPSSPGGADTSYNGWSGFDSLPVLTKTNPAVQQYFLSAPDSVARQWIQRGAAGWRLDVMGDPSFPAGYWETFRNVVKQADPDAIIIGEMWQKDSTLLRNLRGDRADATMNYRLRDALLGFLAPGPFDPKGFPGSGSPLAPSAVAARLQSIQEDYPAVVSAALMNLVDSHDTERVLWTLTPGAATPADREQNAANLAQGKQRVRLASLLQFTIPGSPTIYYGDEVGMTGASDPDDRRTYPWTDRGGNPDEAMRAHYQALGALRRDHPVLANGDFRLLLADDTNNVLAYGRSSAQAAALVAINRGAAPASVAIPVAGYWHDGLTLQGAYGVGNSAAGLTAAVQGGALRLTLAPLSGLVLVNDQADLAPPPAPANLRVTASGDASVALAWDAVPGAAGYMVYRSPLPSGGYVAASATPLTATSFSDSGLRNAQTVYYIVRALDRAGNLSAASNEVSATPHLTIAWANLQYPPTLSHVISTTARTDNVYGQVYIPNVTNLPGPTPTLRAQLGFGPAGTAPAANPAWSWVDAAFNADRGNNDEFVASLLPEVVGRFDYSYRYITSDGSDWFYADLSGPADGSKPLAHPGVLTVLTSGDTTPPATPSGLHVAASSPSAISLAWDAVTGDPTMYGYEVRRSDAPGVPYATLALTTATSFTDSGVSQGGSYTYVVRSVDSSFNRSPDSAPVAATAALRTVTLVFTVTVPATTAGTGLAVHIAGTLNLLNGTLPQWDPGATALTQVDSTHWTITLSGPETTQLQYKYTLGSWNYVEKDAACAEISNRTLTLTYSGNGTQAVNDSVLNWRNVAPCGN